ncbi:TrmB family transcriptional regulator [Candidatus Woesearchaeota archaeon]|nr:TrmB family transcriptional regulator [Candidatus Woesearchaeota archaeon]
MLALKTEKQLKNLGLNSYEVKIWVALLSMGKSTAGELSDITNVPRSRSYDVLESLKKKGFVVMKLGKPIKYIAVPPDKAVENAKKNIRKNASKEIILLNNRKNTKPIDWIVYLHTQGARIVETADLSSALRGRDNIYSHISCMMKRAEKNIFISATQEEFIQMVEKLRPSFERLKNKNINIKILTQLNRQTKKYADKISQFAEVKHTDNKARFCIVDGKEIIFMVLDDTEVYPTYDVGIWVNSLLAKELERFAWREANF